MKFVLSLAVLLFAQFSFADLIKCNFTEPFAISEYNTSTLILRITRPSAPVQIVTNVVMAFTGPGQFNLVKPGNHIVHKINTNIHGSDGMSDLTYPFQVLWPAMSSQANRGLGGCQTMLLRAY